MTRLLTGVAIATLLAAVPAMAQTSKEPSNAGTTAVPRTRARACKARPIPAPALRPRTRTQEDKFKIPSADGDSSGEMGTENTDDARLRIRAA